MNSIIEQVAEAQRLKDSGRVDLAEGVCRQVLARQPLAAGALHLLGAILHLKGQQHDAILYLQKAVQAQPDNASYLVTLGGNLAIAGRIEEATDCFRRAVAANPNAVDAQYNLGLALKHRKDFGAAEECFLKALDIAPTYVDAMANLGFVVLGQERREEAMIVLCNALTLAPTHPLALTTLARIFSEAGKHAEAATMINAVSPNAPETSLFQLANTYEQLANNALTISALRFLVSRYPRSAEALAALATGLIGDFQLAEGIEIARRAIELDPKCASAWCSLGMANLHSGLYEEAYEALTKTINIRPVIGPRVMRDLMLPCIMGTREEVRKSRSVFETNLDKLTSEGLVSRDPLNEIGFTYFYLAYHGENDVHIQQKIARFYEKVAPSLNFVAPHCHKSRVRNKNQKIRVGFYSHFVSKHSVSYSFASILETLNESNEFEVYLVTDAALAAHGVSEVYPSLKGRAIQIPRNLAAAQQKVSALELDILVYLDIGMDPLAFLLAFSRLAPVQCVMGGHPVTTGIRTIDYFLSPASMETPEAQDHYSEKLVLLKHGGFVFQRMEMPAPLKTREQLGMPQTSRIYLCPMTLQKIHPDFDEAIEKILREDHDGSVVFFRSAQSPEWARLLANRFDKTIDPTLRSRIIFMPWIRDQQDLINIIAQSDVVLDPFHFGIGTTGIHVFTAGTPIVTRPSKFLRGRVGYLFCNLLETTECISSSTDEYVATALRISHDALFRQELQRRILKNNYKLFQNSDAAPELVATLKTLVETSI